MTLKSMHCRLKRILPTAYQCFKEVQSPPFIVYGLAGDSDFHADNRHYFSANNGYVELYSDIKMSDQEKAIERLFEKNGIPWTKENEDYIESQRMMYVRWTFQLLGG